MKTDRKPKFSKSYPQKTEGAHIARQARAECNHLSDDVQAGLLKEGLAIIYDYKSGRSRR